MATEMCVKTSAEMASMDFEEMDLCFDLGEGHFVFGFSPEMLRAACARSPKVAYLLADKLTARHCSSDVYAGTLYDRPGYSRRMSDNEWLGKMRQIVRKHLADEIFLIDIDEIGYAEALAAEDARRAEKAARLKAKQDAAVESLAAKRISLEKRTARPVDAAPIPLSYTEAGSGDVRAEERVVKAVFLKADLYAGQLNLSNLITGSRLLSISAETRQVWTAKNPLIVSKFSGIAAGTTRVEYIGEELHVGDAETWATAIRFGAKLALETPVILSEREMLKAMRRRDGGAYYLTLREQIARLQNAKFVITTTHEATIEAMAAAMPEDEAAKDAIKTGQLKITVSLLGDSMSSATERKLGVISVFISSTVRALFGKGLSSWFGEDAYYSLRSPTARRLFLLYARHANPWPFTRPELQEYLGSTAVAPGGFKKTLDKAFAEMLKRGVIAHTPEYAASDVRHGAKAYHVTLAALDFGNGKIITAP